LVRTPSFPLFLHTHSGHLVGAISTVLFVVGHCSYKESVCPDCVKAILLVHFYLFCDPLVLVLHACCHA
jgi:hypothetical protein